MDSLLNVIRAIIDMLPGRCKTINSSFSLVSSLHSTVCLARWQRWPGGSTGERGRGGVRVPRGVCLSVCHVNKDAGMRLSVWRIGQGADVVVRQAFVVLIYVEKKM